MAKIYIRGHATPQTVDVKTAKMVDEIKNNKALGNDYYIRLDGFSCDKGDVKSVIVFDVEDEKSSRSDVVKDENSERIAKYNKDFVEEVRSYANGDLEKKLQFNLKVAKMYCFALTGKDVEEYKPLLKPIFVEELKTQRLVVNPTKYLKVFEVEEMEGKQGLTKIDYLVRKAPLRIMQNYLLEVYDVIR